MLDLKELLIMLGLAVGGPSHSQDMTFYRQKLSNEMVLEQKLKEEIKALEYRKLWDDVNQKENADFAVRWFKDKKSEDKLGSSKKDLNNTRKKIKVLKNILEKDSLDKVVPQTQVL